MRILLVIDCQNDPRLGSAKVIHKLREEFQKLGHSCDAIFSEDMGASPHNARARQALGPTLAARTIAKTFKERGPYDVVDVASAEGFIFGLQRKLGAYKNVRFISRSNGLEHLNYRRMLDDHREGLMRKPLSKRLWYPTVRLSQVAGAARLSDKLLLLNEADLAFALSRRWKTANEIAVIPHGVSGHLLDRRSLSETRGEGLLFCGTWTGMKGIDYLVKAFSSLIEDGMSLNLTILGGGVPEEEIRSAFPSPVRSHLTVLSKVSEDEVVDHYRKHDALVCCSTYEGFGMVLLEAMSQGLPVISSRVGCAISLIRDGETGALVPTRDSRALASAIRRIIEDRALRLTLARNAFELVRKMTWQQTAVKTLAEYGS
jgi:glycosyltransferase involved in cell wall biosynthesis